MAGVTDVAPTLTHPRASREGHQNFKRERRQYEGRQQARWHEVTNLAEKLDKTDFTMEQKQAAIAQTLTAVIIMPSGKGGRFHSDQTMPVFREDNNKSA
ncbi:MAG: hypothetical protein ACRDRI_14095 [Pseudonocardiaceae bacterium]